MEFRLYIQVNPDSVHYYPYVGVSKDTTRLINICAEHIEISERADNLFHEADYLLTSRSLGFNLPHLDDLVEAYIHMREYSIAVRFNEYKHTTLTYHSPTNERPKDYDIFIGYPDEHAVQLVETIYPLMEEVKEFVLPTDYLPVQ